MMIEKYDVIIIGAGLSGLLSATLLSKNGLKVCILEKNNNIGGMMQPFKRKGVYSETGMNFFGACKERQIQNKLFQIFDIAEDLKISDIKEFEFIFENEKYIIPNNFTAFKNQMINYFPDEYKGIKIFTDEIKNVVDNLTVENIYERNSYRKYEGKSASEFINSVTENKKLRSLLSFNSLLYGNDIEKIPFYVYAVITGSFLTSVGMFTDGTKQFIDILRKKIFNNNGTIYTKTKVVKINTNKKTVVECVCEDGRIYTAKYFLSSVHPQKILPKIETSEIKSFYRKRIDALANSKSAFIINIILKENTVLFDNSPKFIKYNDKDEIKSILIYFPISGKKGKYSSVLKIMIEDDINSYKQWINTLSGKRGRDYQIFKENKTKYIFNKIEQIYPNFIKKIQSYYTSSPLTFRDYTGSSEGSSYGILHDINKLSESIIPVRTKLDNLFLTGQSINFHGLLGVSVTTLSVCSAILKKKSC